MSRNWHWFGKLALLATSLLPLVALRYFQPGFQWSDAGFTLKQNPGSLKAALTVLGMLLLFRLFLIGLLGPDDGVRDPGELTFLATMNGLEKEPLYRGVLLYTLSLALVARTFLVFGVQLSLAGLLLVGLFALSHGLFYNGDFWMVLPAGFFFTAIHGLVYLWLREKTGSLVFPILCHNAVLIFGQLL